MDRVGCLQNRAGTGALKVHAELAILLLNGRTMPKSESAEPDRPECQCQEMPRLTEMSNYKLIVENKPGGAVSSNGHCEIEVLPLTRPRGQLGGEAWIGICPVKLVRSLCKLWLATLCTSLFQPYRETRSGLCWLMSGEQRNGLGMCVG